ncbi:MAG TPA: PadR family transcriptional regulator [Candidatus Nanoarchaeia archaeon]|nr:PadR family transcriptional regulator [Candidatus Nanoarchaeia archaeon]
MKGFLSFLVLWIVSKKPMNGSDIAKELEKRKGSKPSPGTIYPVLKELKSKGLVSIDKNKAYSLTKNGKESLKDACTYFGKVFYDMREFCDS